MRLFSFNHTYESFDQKQLVRLVMLYWFLIITTVVSLGFIFLPTNWERWLNFLLLNVAMNLAHLLLLRFNKTHFASWSLPISIWVMITVPCYTSGGILAPGILTQLSIVLIASLLKGWRGGLTIGLLSMVTDLFFVYMDMHGYLPVTSVVHTPLTRWIAAFIPYCTVIALQYHTTEIMRTNMVSLKNELNKRQAVEGTLAKTIVNLQERVKEFKTLYTISHLLENEDATVHDLCQHIADAMPLGWQYPEDCGVKITIDDIACASINYRPSVYSQSVHIKTKSGKAILIEVIYKKAFTAADEGPFLKEERKLLTLIAEMLKTYIESKESRKALKDYQHALDLSSAVSISDKDGIIRFANEKFCQLTNYTLEELQGQFFGKIMSEMHTMDCYSQLNEALGMGQPFRGEFCNVTKEGKLQWVDSSIVPFLDDNGKITQYLSINYDITERKLVQEKIQKSEQLLSKLTSQVPGNTYMFEIDASGHPSILFANKGSDLYSSPSQNLKESPDEINAILHNEDREIFLQAMQAANASLTPISLQYRKVINGEVKWRWMQAKAEKNDDGKVIWYGATSDITPLVNYIADIEQMLFDISHVLRRPITSLIGLTSIATKEEMTSEKWQQLCGKVKQAAGEMDTFVNELNTIYSTKKMQTPFKLNIQLPIDKRSSLFRR